MPTFKHKTEFLFLTRVNRFVTVLVCKSAHSISLQLKAAVLTTRRYQRLASSKRTDCIQSGPERLTAACVMHT
jgi:hypothetical protein